MKNLFPNLHSTTFTKGVLANTQPRSGKSTTMKNMSPILLAGLIAGWSATTAAAGGGAPLPAAPAAAEQPAPPATPAAAPAAPAPARVSYANLTAGTADQGLILNLRGVTVDQALNFLSESAGFTLIRETSTDSPAKDVDVVSDTPLDKDDIIRLFNKVLASHDLTVMRDGNTLTVMTTQAAAEYAGTPVNVLTNYSEIPEDAQLVTEVIPVHTLNPKQVLTDLYSLIPPGARMNSSEAGTSILMTATRRTSTALRKSSRRLTAPATATSRSSFSPTPIPRPSPRS